MIEWQTIVVVLIITTALFYIARRGFAKIRSMRTNDESCETGCGKCESSSSANKKSKDFFQVSRQIANKK